MAKIDIMLPYWGEFDLLKQAVDSVIAQTSPNWRLTILDDHYPSEQAYAYFKQHTHPQITYIRHPQNIGITNNFNQAVERAKHEYFSILGCDDRLLPTYVETALKNIGEADWYQPGVEVIDADGNVYLPLVDRIKSWLRPKKAGLHSGEKLAASICHGNWLYFPSIVWRTSVLRNYRFDTKYTIVEDMALELQLILDGKTLALDNTTTFQYRRSATSLSSAEKAKGGVRFDEEEAVYSEFASKFARAGWPKASRAARLRIISRLHKLVSHA